jgi:small conductance mechanosensitive channel
MEQIGETTNEMIVAGQAAFNQASALAVTYSFSILGAIILLVAGYIIAGVLERSLYAGLGRFRGFDETLRRFFSKVARYVLLVLVGVTVLAQFGVQTASIIAALGAIGLAIGLALQGTLQNIAAGIMLLALRPFRVGEYIDAGSVSGTIQEIGLFATELKTFDGIYMMAPNSELWNTPVKNYSRNPQRMAELVIGIGYEDDIGVAQSTLLETIKADERVLAEPAPSVFVAELADSAVTLKVRYWTLTTNWWATKLDLSKGTKEALDAKGISIPFPQRTLHVVGGREAMAAAE